MYNFQIAVYAKDFPNNVFLGVIEMQGNTFNDALECVKNTVNSVIHCYRESGETEDFFEEPGLPKIVFAMKSYLLRSYEEEDFIFEYFPGK